MSALSDWLALWVARCLLAYARLCWWTSHFQVDEHAEQVLVRTWDSRTPTVYAYWHDEFMLCSLLAYVPRIQYPLCGCNDAFGGRVMAAAWESIGAPVARLPRGTSREARLALLARGLESARRLVIAADYGAPWFKARPTAAQLARETGGAVVALHVAASPAFSVGTQARRFCIPLPFARYQLSLSEPIDVSDGGELFAGQLGIALDALRTTVEAQAVLQPNAS